MGQRALQARFDAVSPFIPLGTVWIIGCLQRTWKALRSRKIRSYASFGGSLLSASCTVSFSSGIKSSARRPVKIKYNRQHSLFFSFLTPQTSSPRQLQASPLVIVRPRGAFNVRTYLIFCTRQRRRTSWPAASSISSAMVASGYTELTREQTWRRKALRGWW